MYIKYLAPQIVTRYEISEIIINLSIINSLLCILNKSSSSLLLLSWHHRVTLLLFFIIVQFTRLKLLSKNVTISVRNSSTVRKKLAFKGSLNGATSASLKFTIG